MYQKIPSPPQKKKKKNSEIQIVTIYFFIKKYSLVFPCFLCNKNVWMYQSNFQTNHGRDQHKIKAEFIGGHFMFRTGNIHFCNLFCLWHLLSRSGSVFQFEGMMNQAQSPTNTSPSRQSSTSGQSK